MYIGVLNVTCTPGPAHHFFNSVYVLRIQVYVTVVLVATLTVYAYLLPYKSAIANACEVAVLLNMILLLLLSTTSLVRESFGDVLKVRAERWLLYCLYYMPILLLIALCLCLSVYRVVR